MPIGCSNGALPDGISVKGQGGYIVVPPSRRKGRPYIVHRDIDPIEAPQWLVDLILQGRSPTANTPSSSEPVDLDELADLMPYVPNNDLSWEHWTAIGLAVYAASDGQGFDLFDAFSQRSSKYDPGITRERWDEITGSPPNRTGINKLRKIARANGWVPKLYVTEPTYPADDIFTTAGMARSKTRQVIRDFLDYHVACPGSLRNVFVDYGFFSKKIMATRSRRPRGAYSHRHRQNPDRHRRARPMDPRSHDQRAGYLRGTAAQAG